jgi:para-nitrobenzyl esterase
MSRRTIVVLALIAIAIGGLWLARRARRVAPEPPHVADAASKRSLPAGEVVGFVGPHGNHAWLGLPFAQPPVGELRWRAPKPAAPWTGTREALAFGPHCPQYPSMIGGVPGDPATLSGVEDCLYLNVYAPRFDPAQVPAGAARLPVMFWIYGGGNVIGLADNYEGGRLAQEENVVVVTVNYRIGPLGWFRHPVLAAGGSADDASGDFGTLDLIQGLRWVQANIAAFGGDPARVTIFGESAGGTNVFTLLLSPRASGLFAGAISESGGTYTATAGYATNWSDDPEPGHARSSSEIIGRLLVADKRAADRGAAKALLASTPPAETAAYLRAKSVLEVFAAYQRKPDEILLDMPRPIADGDVLPADDPVERLARGEVSNQVPVLFGTNRDEQKLFMFGDPRYVKRWLGFLPRVRQPELYLAVADALSASWKVRGADAPAGALRKTQARVFAYRFDWDEEPSLLGFDAGKYLGAGHGMEIAFVFGHWTLGRERSPIFTSANQPGRETLSKQMRSYWANFAYTGEPGRGRAGDQPEWTAWDPAEGGPKYLVLDTPAGGGLRMANAGLSFESVVASVASDARLATPREKCWAYHELFRFGDEAHARYAGVENGLCAKFPFDAYPWGA